MDTKVLKQEVENWLQGYFENKGSYNRKIYEAMFYSINVGGKRIRPILCLLIYNMYEAEYSKALPVASALEMIHTYSLIHDDLPCMDNDDLRRGKPTNHKIFGDGLAVLAGDGLLNEAMSVLLEYSLNNSKEALKASVLIAEAAGAEGMIGGQVVDILSEGKSIEKDQLFYMHSKKTGALIKAAILSGAILGNAPEEDIKKLNDYGEKLGLAFQIKDDILDVTGDTDILGKKTNSDDSNNKTTFVTTFGLEGCKEMCENLTDECIKLLESIDKNTEQLKELTLFLLRRDY
jgi:geranylgeranyl diphosphate synthase type II